MDLDFPEIWRVLTAHFQLGDWSPHGPNHWKNVEANGLSLARDSDADIIVVRLFAVFHDCERQTDSTDPEHGQRAAALALGLHGSLFSIAPQQLDDLCYACTWHHRGKVTDHPTIGVCWDADRLDLPRVGIRPDVKMMSTAEGKRRVGAMR
jgi:uncharacterized protein